MRELKILAVVVFFTLLTYIGVEPYAHSKMHKHVEGHNFTYDGTADIQEATKALEEAQKQGRDVAKAQAKVTAKRTFWSEVDKIAKMPANVANGEMVFGTCLACHNGAGINMGGVIPPNLDHAGALYDKRYLIALIKDPAMASNVDHKYENTMMHPMGSVSAMVPDAQQIADVVAYMLAKKAGDVSPKVAYEEACARCHALRYAKITQLGETPSFSDEKDKLAHKIKVLQEQELIETYMGKLPPDLSMIVRARSGHFLETLVENPQSQLAGTSMPRVGLSQAGYDKVHEYLTEIGDPSKKHREALGPWVIGFFVIFTILAYLWKKHHWRDLH